MNVLDLVELRDRGFSEDTFTDDELRRAEANTWRLIELLINRKLDVTSELRLDGEDSKVLPLPTQVVSLDSVTIEYSSESSTTIDMSEVVLYNRTVPKDFDSPKIVWREGQFPEGYQNVILTGQFGYVEGDLDIEPLMEVCKRLLYIQFKPLIAGGAETALPYVDPTEIKEEITDKYSYVKFDQDSISGIFNDGLVNAILQEFAKGTDCIELGWV